MNEKVARLAFVLAALCSVACLKGERRSTLYVSPSGAVQWVAVEEDIHSDDSDPAAAAREEAAFLDDVGVGRHRAALALGELGGTSLEWAIVRAERPAHVVTQARFDDLGSVLQSLFTHFGADVSVERERENDVTRLRIWIGERGQEDEQDVVSEFVFEQDEICLVLSDGRFTRADGFRVSEDERTATLDEHSEAWDGYDDGELLEIVLEWTAGR